MAPDAVGSLAADHRPRALAFPRKLRGPFNHLGPDRTHAHLAGHVVGLARARPYPPRRSAAARAAQFFRPPSAVTCIGAAMAGILPKEPPRPPSSAAIDHCGSNLLERHQSLMAARPVVSRLSEKGCRLGMKVLSSASGLRLRRGRVFPKVVMAPQAAMAAIANAHVAYNPRSISAPLRRGAAILAIDISD